MKKPRKRLVIGRIISSESSILPPNFRRTQTPEEREEWLKKVRQVFAPKPHNRIK